MAVRIGRQTPTQAVILPYRISKGREAVKLYEQSGRKAQPWQASLLKDMMGLTADQLWTHTKFGYSVPRRNGKNEVVVMREFWGLVHGEQIGAAITGLFGGWDAAMVTLIIFMAIVTSPGSSLQEYSTHHQRRNPAPWKVRRALRVCFARAACCSLCS